MMIIYIADAHLSILFTDPVNFGPLKYAVRSWGVEMIIISSIPKSISTEIGQ
jgi:hypothetical protein